MRVILKDTIRRLLGETRYAELRDWAGDVGLWRGGGGGRRPSEELIRCRVLKAWFKGYVMESLARRRGLERELAQLRFPEHYRPDLDVVAEMSGSKMSVPSRSGTASVIITNFNYGRYVGQAIDSVLRQTHEGVELVVVDDASSDSSPPELQRALAPVSSMPWHLVRLKHNIGLPAARNVGLRVARGEFVFILDADNHLLPQCLADHVRAAQENQADAVYGMIRTFGATSGLLSDREFSAQQLAQGPYIDAMALFRRSTLLDMGLYAMEPALYGWEDYELWVRLAAQARPVAFIPKVLSHYRFHQANMIGVTSLDTRGAWAYLFERYPTIFGRMSAAEGEGEAERRSRQVSESAEWALGHESGVHVECGCEEIEASGRKGAAERTGKGS